MRRELPEGWRSLPIGQVCSLVNGRAFKPTEWSQEGLPIIRIQNLNDPTKPFNRFKGEVSPKHLVQAGDVVLSWSGTPGTSFGCFVWTREPGVLNQHIFKVDVRHDLCEPIYFVHAVNSVLDEMIRQAHGGVGLRHITKSRLEQICLPIAPLTEQRRIVARIQECLTRVEEIGTLQRELSCAADAVLASALAAVFSEVEAHYSQVGISDVTLESAYGTNQKCTTSRPGLAVLRIPNIRAGEIDLCDLKYAELRASELRKVLLRRGDLLIVRTNGSPNLVGRCAVFEEDGQFGYASYLIRLRLRQDLCLPAYLAFYLASTTGRDAIARIRRTSAGQFNINSENIGTIRFPLPPLEEQGRLVEHMTAIRRTVRRLRAEHDDEEVCASVLRSSILEKAFAGEL